MPIVYVFGKGRAFVTGEELVRRPPVVFGSEKGLRMANKNTMMSTISIVRMVKRIIFSLAIGLNVRYKKSPGCPSDLTSSLVVPRVV